MKRALLVLVALALMAGCGDSATPTAPISPGGTPAGFGISDGAHKSDGINFGNEDFFFLPPAVKMPTSETFKDRPFHATIRPRVSICRLSGTTCAEEILGFSAEQLQVSLSDESYHVNWDTKAITLDPALNYRIQVFVQTRLLGFADVNPQSSGSELKNVDTNEEIPLLDGRTLPIRFRIEQGATCVFKPCTEVIVKKDVGGTFYAVDKFAAIQIPPDAMPVDNVLLTIETKPVPDKGLCVADPTTPGFVWQQWEGCYVLKTEPDLRTTTPRGFQKEVIVGVCMEPAVPEPLEPYVELLKHDDDGRGIQRNPSVAAPFLDCTDYTGTQPTISGVFGRAQHQLLALARGAFRLIEPRALLAVDGGLGTQLPIGDDLSTFFWGLPVTATLQSGSDGQVAPVNTPVAIAPAVVIRTAHDHPEHPAITVDGAPVKLRVTGGGGKLVSGTTELEEIDVLSGPDGIATLPTGTVWRLGPTPGSNTLRISGPFTNGVLTITATGTADDVIGSWIAAANLSATRRDHSATLLNDGDVLIVGGTASGAELYDAGTGQFEPLTPAFEHGSGASATKLSDGRVLIVGGRGAPGRAEIYDPSSGMFAAVAQPLVTPRAHHTATLLSDGRVLIAGGQQDVTGGPQTISAAELFDPVAGTFSSIGSLAGDRSGHGAVRLGDGTVLIAGGTQTTTPGSGIQLATAEIFDPERGTFQSTGSMSVGRTSLLAALLDDGTVLVAGGLSSQSAEVYNPTTGAFLLTEGAPAVSYAAGTMTLLADGRVLLAGGAESGPVTQATAEIYDPSNGAFSAAAPMIAARQQHSATLLADGRVLVVGGFSFAAESDLSSAEIFSLGSPTVIR